LEGAVNQQRVFSPIHQPRRKKITGSHSCSKISSLRRPRHAPHEKSASKANEFVVGSKILEGTINCIIKQTSEKTDIGVIATVFNAYIADTGEKIGKCSLHLISGFSDCEDVAYQTGTVVGVIRIDSFARKRIRGVGTMLMQAAIEYGITQGAEGRIVLHAAGDALIFYRKLGMKLGFSDPQLEEAMSEEAARLASGQADPRDLLSNDARPMYLPKEAIDVWRAKIQAAPVLGHTPLS